MVSMYLTEGIKGAARLHSEKRMQEAKAIYREARQVWPSEARVKELAELFVM